jgi:4-alpha-glucanotransferase
MPWPLVYCALRSVARLAVLPAQDILALGSDSRMNIPGKQQGNWHWRLAPGQLDDKLAAQCRQLNEMFGRC